MPLAPNRKGITTISWGSDSVTAGGLTTAIVDSYSFKPIKERSKIANNQGFTVATIDLVDGREATLNCVWDSAITWPVEGDVITLTRRGTVTSKFEITEIEDSGGRKKEGYLNIKAEQYVGITLA